MNQISNSDMEMATKATFSSILSEIQFSNLNFKIEMTPFAANIILKKTSLKDKNGVPAIPSPPILHLLQQAQQEIFILREENRHLQVNVKYCEAAIEESSKTINEMSIKLEEALEDVSESVKRNDEKVIEAEVLKKKLAVQDHSIVSLKKASKDLQIEIEHLKNDTKHASKCIKTKEREVSKGPVR